MIPSKIVVPVVTLPDGQVPARPDIQPPTRELSTQANHAHHGVDLTSNTEADASWHFKVTTRVVIVARGSKGASDAICQVPFVMMFVIGVVK